MPEPQTPAAETTIQIDPVAAYYKRRAEAAENECLLMAARMRDQQALLVKAVGQVQALAAAADQQQAADKAEAKPARPRKKGGDA